MKIEKPADLKNRAGQILYRELPEEYRYRDQPPSEGELGDLEAFLHGNGHLLELIRGTTEQIYADSFAEEIDGRSIQTWMVPYLAELVGAELVAPDPDQRIEELNNSVLWYKSKGTLRTIDDVSDVVSGTETVTREGWRYVLTTPRMNLPPFTLPPDGMEAEQNPEERSRVGLSNDATSGGAANKGCPDFRRINRAVDDPSGGNPLYRLQYPKRDDLGFIAKPKFSYWKPNGLGGVPAFPGHFDDDSVRCPDMREARLDRYIGPHPRRSAIHVRPPSGMFEGKIREVEIADFSRLGLSDNDSLTPFEVLFRLGLLAGNELAPDKLAVKLTSNNAVISKDQNIEFHGILFKGKAKITVKDGGQLTLVRCALKTVVLENTGSLKDAPSLLAKDTVLKEIIGAKSFAELEYCTVTARVNLSKLNASDCIFEKLSATIRCPSSHVDDLLETARPTSCVRFSRVEFQPSTPALNACFLKSAPANTGDNPRFIRLWLKDSQGKCTLRQANYGEPGYGVLDTAAPISVLAGAEDEGEMGVGHHMFLAAGLRALRKKLEGFLPLGQEVVIFYDPLLVQVPPAEIDN